MLESAWRKVICRSLKRVFENFDMTGSEGGVVEKHMKVPQNAGFIYSWGIAQCQ